MLVCGYLSQEDTMWHGTERHDEFCLLYNVWCPDCKNCEHNYENEDECE